MVRKILSITIIALGTAFCANAQSMQSLYFLDNNLYGYRINPAVASERDFAGLVVNNVDLGANSSLGLDSFLFDNGSGKIVTGYNNAIPSDRFLQGLEQDNRFNAVENFSLMSCGFWTKNDFFHNIEINFRGYEDMAIPKDLFALMKVGDRAEPYDLAGLQVSTQAYLELAYGLSKTIGDKFSVGGRVKLLTGILNLSAQSGHTRILLNGQGNIPDMNLGFSGAAFTQQGLKPAGLGAAVDLGLTFKPVNGLTLGLSVIDLGAVRWGYNLSGKVTDLTGNPKIETNTTDNVTPSTEMLPVTINAGARYRMPFYERLSVGLAGSYRTGRQNPYAEVRVGGCVTPLDWISLSGNYGLTSCGNSFGVGMNLNLAFFHIHLGVESYSGRAARFRDNNGMVAFMPLSKFRYATNLGLTIAFGKRHKDYSPKDTD